MSDETNRLHSRLISGSHQAPYAIVVGPGGEVSPPFYSIDEIIAFLGQTAVHACTPVQLEELRVAARLADWLDEARPLPGGSYPDGYTLIESCRGEMVASPFCLDLPGGKDALPCVVMLVGQAWNAQPASRLVVVFMIDSD